MYANIKHYTGARKKLFTVQAETFHASSNSSSSIAPWPVMTLPMSRQ